MDPGNREKLLRKGPSDSGELEGVLPINARRRNPRHSIQSRVDFLVKAAFGFVAVMLLVIICTYAGSNTVFSAPGGDEDARRGEVFENKARDCRSTGCNGDFECVLVEADFACFVPPCPTAVYECLPNAVFDDPDDAIFSIQRGNPDANRAMRKAGSATPTEEAADVSEEPSEAYYACLQQHGGQSVWRHPKEPCNTCRCTEQGRVACTKRLCNPGNLDFSAFSSRADPGQARVQTTIMVPVSGSNSAAGASAMYTSIAIDIQA
ncbi:hypothetical protein GQ54DRAFT_304010 [Martensiomyces pterosporus]|nr:hypothetical protein GQ54DRAFT_304010 [Martensiomyces pterosporus]